MKSIMRVSLLIAVVAAGVVLVGCGETYERQTMLVGVPVSMTTADVVAAAKAGEDEGAILARLQQRGYDGALTSKDVDRLRGEGVPESVIDWMLAHPAPQSMMSAPIVATGTAPGPDVVYVDRSPDVVYVDRSPDVIYVERPPRVTYSLGFEYSWGHYRHYPRYEGYRYHSYPRTRVYSGSGGRVYRYTSRH
jgi:hypothetical protein